ncbi:MAG: DUF362 domain-containing protein [Phycisphaerae bacterium]|nr:DUF362 domain-containing protein [Phycisphaerae bacterium]
MGCSSHRMNRRDLLVRAAKGIVGGAAAMSLPAPLLAQVGGAVATRPSAGAPSRAALTTGGSRGDNVFAALKLIEDDIRRALARKKRVLLKPNMVCIHTQLACSHVECLEAVLEFLSPMVKGEIFLGDSPAGGRATEGFEALDYRRLARQYKVRFIDFDDESVDVLHATDHRYHAVPVRAVKLALDPDTFVISSAIPKTHDRAVLTLSLKNIVVGAAVKDPGFRWDGKGTGQSDKMIIHGGPQNQAIHYNLFHLARQLKPDLSILDGFQGMEGNGPCSGTAVEHKVAIASTDWLAADRIATELMGFEFRKVGYLWFAAQAGLGQGDLEQIEVLGEPIARHVKPYCPHETIEEQYKWMTRGA